MTMAPSEAIHVADAVCCSSACKQAAYRCLTAAKDSLFPALSVPGSVEFEPVPGVAFPDLALLGRREEVGR
jgi:hypothetical protein